MESHPPHIDHHKSKHARLALAQWRQRPWHMIQELVVDMIPVVFGILLALGINNWNHARTEQEQAEVYLNRIADDLRSDVQEFSDDLATYERFRQAKSFFTTRFTEQSPVDSVRYYFNVLYGLTSPIVNRSGFSSLQSSGRISLLKNQTITTELFELYDTRLASLSLAVDGYTTIRQAYILPYLFKLGSGPSLRTTRDYVPYVRNRYFQTLMSFLFYDEIAGKYRRVINQQKELIQLIETELGH